MAQPQSNQATLVAGARRLRWIALTLAVAFTAPALAQTLDETIDSPPPEFAGRSIDVPANSNDERGPQDEKFLDPQTARFDAWEPLVADGAECEEPLRPFDWMRHWGFHHSSTEGRYVDRGLPLQHSSWLNRPYHADWFVGPVLMDSTDGGRVAQHNDLFGGLRLGWDFDYFWGLEWRIGWSDPSIFSETLAGEIDGAYMVSDIDLVYYPWGDTRVRPYFQVGLGVTEITTIHEDGFGQETYLLSMPFGLGIQFPFTHWLAGRLEIMDNLAFGNDGVDTMNNFSFTAGMEMRLGARPNSYWPWRSSRNIW
jgi:hypothetical protein